MTTLLWPYLLGVHRTSSLLLALEPLGHEFADRHAYLSPYRMTTLSLYIPYHKYTSKYIYEYGRYLPISPPSGLPLQIIAISLFEMQFMPF